MKPTLLAALFLVTWSEHELDCTVPYGVCFSVGHAVTAQEYSDCLKKHDDCRIIEVGHSVKLRSQKDVDLFVGYDGPCRSNPPVSFPVTVQQATARGWCVQKGLISDKAFNIKVVEIKELTQEEQDYLDKGKRDVEEMRGKR